MIITEKSEFGGIGYLPSRYDIICEAIRKAFENDRFDICFIHSLPEFSYDTFAGWARSCHCNRLIDKRALERVKAYVVNYFLCPDATDEYEVFAHMYDIWPTKVIDSKSFSKRIFKIGRLSIYWKES